MNYQVCKKCGASLDFNEKCDCEDEYVKKVMLYESYLRRNFKKGQNGQMTMILDKEKIS